MQNIVLDEKSKSVIEKFMQKELPGRKRREYSRLNQHYNEILFLITNGYTLNQVAKYLSENYNIEVKNTTISSFLSRKRKKLKM